MQILRIAGETLDQALMEAKRRHGDEALVLGHESRDGGGVTLSVVVRPKAPGGAVATKPASRRASSARTTAPRPAKPGRGAAPKPAPRTASAPVEDPGLADVRRRLIHNGATVKWAEGIAQATARLGKRGAYAIDGAAAICERLVQPASSPRVQGKTHVLAFAGTTGAGKTTTLAKLGVQLTRSGRRIAMVTMDTYRVGAVEQLRTYAELLQCPVEVALNGRQLREVIPRFRNVDVVLLDTTGRSPRDASNLAELSEALDAGRRSFQLDPYLVLAAPTPRADLNQVLKAFAPIEPHAAILTKVDESAQPGTVLEAVGRARLPVAFLADGQDVAGNLHRARPSHFSDLMLQGRIA